MFRARQLSAESIAEGDPTGWFERLYTEGEAGKSVVPWIQGTANPVLAAWAAGLSGAGKRALVVGCGTGEDAEFLAGLGFAVTAFDLAPTAIAAAKRTHACSVVTYEVADLLALPAAWAGAFDLVFEAYTVQPLFGPVRDAALAALSGPVAPGGTLLVVAFATGETAPERSPAMMPWPLTRAEIDLAGGPLHTESVDFLPAGDPPLPHLPHWRAEFRRDSSAQ
jgi:2-polyprenyl-3-methyl-5-hydroxy-6-metoxy-1,4-benzoquinol methylase